MSEFWHINNRNKNNTDIPEKENFVVLDGVMGVSCLWYGGEEPELIFWENVKKWCYLDELIKDQETTRKALDVAVDALKENQHWFGVIRISMISHLNNENGTILQHYDTDPTVINIDKAKVLLNKALEQINEITKNKS